MGRGIIWVDRKNARKTSTWERVDRTLLAIEIELSASGVEMCKKFEVLKIVLVHRLGESPLDLQVTCVATAAVQAGAGVEAGAGARACLPVPATQGYASSSALAAYRFAAAKGIPRVKVVPAEPEGCRP